MEHELGLTRLFNENLAGLANGILSAVGLTAHDAAHPWENWVVMDIMGLMIQLGVVPPPGTGK